MRRALVSMVALVAFLASTGTVFAVEVLVRGGSHPAFGRIVFDWPIAVTYSATISNRQLAVRFNSPISAKLDSALRNLGSFVHRAEISKDGRVARFQLTGAFKLRSFKNGNAIVIDILRGADQPDRPLPALDIRVSKHPTYTRLVFDWRYAVTYSATLGDQKLKVRFDRTARIDLDKLRRDLPPVVANPGVNNDSAGMALTLAVPADTRLRHFRSGTNVVVDILIKSADIARADSRPARQAAAKATLAVPALNSENAKQNQPVLEKTAARPSDYRPRRKLSKAKSDPPADAVPSTTLKSSASAEIPDGKMAENVAEAEAMDSTPARAIVAIAVQNAKTESVSKGTGKVLVSLVFEWSDPVGAAVFERAGFVWIVFDKRAPLDLAPLRAAGKGLVSRLEQLPIGKATVLRMVSRGNLRPFARRDGTNWVIDFKRGRIRPGIQIPIEATSRGDGPALFFTAIDVGDIFRIPDPEVGDVIMVATVQASSQGIAVQRNYPEFQILASTQGIAIVPFSDVLDLNKHADGLILSIVGGLHISGISPYSDHASGSASSGRVRRIFKIAQWPLGAREEIFKFRQELQESIARQPVAKRNNARLKLAQFYFSRGLAPEAKGVLQVIESEDERLVIQPEFKALKGAVAILNGDVDKATRNLNDPRLDKYDEIRLWRGLVAAARMRWKEASLYFKQGDAVLHGYPEPIKSRLALVRIETALKARNTGAAGQWLSVIGKSPDGMTRGEKAAMRYLQGRLRTPEQ